MKLYRLVVQLEEVDLEEVDVDDEEYPIYTAEMTNVILVSQDKILMEEVYEELSILTKIVRRGYV